MTTNRIVQIPIAQIRVLNPRTRNRKTFRGIVNNIETVGLKKPITVFRRNPADDGTQYDLVCGQGRLEAIAALGGKRIPAIITEAPLKRRFLMSLVENVARKRPPLSDLLREVKILRSRGYGNADIAAKLGMGHTYVGGIIHLIDCGEDRLVEQVEAGSIPITVAIKIATAPTGEIQRELSESYARGELRGGRLIAVQRLIARRKVEKRTLADVTLPKATQKNLTKEFEELTHRQRALVRRAAIVHERLALLNEAARQILADPTLIALLKSEGLDSLPKALFNSPATLEVPSAAPSEVSVPQRNAQPAD